MGQSSTKVDTELTSGYALVFPQLTLGFVKQMGDDTAMLFEASAEVINSKEEFDDGTLQTANMLNARLGVGFKF